MPLQIETQPLQHNSDLNVLGIASFQALSAVALSGTFFGDGSRLTGAALPGQSNVNSAMITNSANWNNNFTTINTGSANWTNAYTVSNANSANWNSNLTTTGTNSADWSRAYTVTSSNSSRWDNNFTTTNTNSANWNNNLTTVNSNSADWSRSYTNVSSNSANWNNNLTTVNSNSADWSRSYTNVSSNSANWNNNLTTVNSNSANWSRSYTNVSSNSANWNNNLTTVNSNSANWATYNYANTFLPLTGGTITGPTQINSNLTIFGNLTATGTTTFTSTFFTTTSSLSVVHFGAGPALWVGSNGTGDIASFYDIDQNTEVLHVGGSNGSFPNVGVKTSVPNVDFTVNGQISANNTIWSANGNSNNWNSVHSNVNSNSANWILNNGNTGGSNLLIGTNDNFNLNLETNNTVRMSIGTSGRIGINQLTPSATLTVSAVNALTNLTDGSQYALALNNTGGANGDLGFGTDASNSYIQSFNSKALQINNIGNNIITGQTGLVGIGTGATALSDKLTIGGVVRVLPTSTTEGGQITLMDATGSGAWEIDNQGMGATSPTLRIFRDKGVANGTAVTITSAGNIGVGTTTPGLIKLDVAGVIRSVGETVVNAAAGVFRFVAFRTNNTSRWDMGADVDAETGSNAGSNFFLHRFSDAGTFLERVLSITRSTGNVGIGTITPTTKLDVAGTVKATQFSGNIDGAAAFLNTAASSTLVDSITGRINSGFYENFSATQVKGWPVNTGNWYHLIASTHSNTDNYYSLQLAADFYTNNLYYRSVGGDGARVWDKVITSSPAGVINGPLSVTTSLSSPSISATGFFGDGSRLTNIPGGTLPAAATFSISVSSPSISAVNYFGQGNEAVLSDGYFLNNTGSGHSTLSLNYSNGVYVGLSGSGSLYALGVPRNYCMDVPAPAVNSGAAYFTNVFPAFDRLASDTQYEIEYNLYYVKNTAGTVQYQLSSNSQLRYVAANYTQTAVGGIRPNASPTMGAVISSFPFITDLPATGSLTATASAYAFVKANLKTSTTPAGIVLNVINSAGNITPLQGSYRKITRLT